MQPAVLRALEFDRIREVLAARALTPMGRARLLALDPASGRERWIYDPRVEVQERPEPFLVMEEIQGPTLDALLAAGSAPIRYVIPAIVQALRGLEALHRALASSGGGVAIPVAPARWRIGHDSVKSPALKLPPAMAWAPSP